MQVARAVHNEEHVCCGQYKYEHVKKISPRFTNESNQFHQ
jgi:hypothetical protein